MIPTSAAISVKELRKYYGAIKAVDGVSFDVGDGEIFGILGPNGAGKTTTLEMIEGLREADSGSAEIYGTPVSSKSKKIKELIGVQLQSTALFEYLTVLETVELFASFYRRTGVSRNERAHSLLASVGLNDKENAEVKHLSGGQKQRLSIALALVSQPRVIFLDEPTTGLDPAARRHLWDVIGDIRASGKTVVLTTHYMEEAEVLCDRVAIMDQGRIMALDSPLQLIEDLGASYRISVRCTPSLPIETLEAIPGASNVTELGEGGHVVRTEHLQATMEAIVAQTSASGANLDHMQISSANLEDVFLHFTGRGLRD